MLTQARLKEVLHYDPETGVFKWVVLISNVKAGAVAGSKHNKGYLMISIDSKRYLSHRLAWFYIHGWWPTDQIDHINGVKDDNRLCNLREATPAENARNTGIRATNTSGYKGVSLRKEIKKYAARVRHNGRCFFLGYFDCPKEAHAAYCAAAEKLNGEFMNDGTGDDNE